MTVKVFYFAMASAINSALVWHKQHGTSAPNGNTRQIRVYNNIIIVILSDIMITNETIRRPSSDEYKIAESICQVAVDVEPA